MQRKFVYLAWLASLIPLHPLVADDEGIAFFEKRIRPILVENCYECHSQGAKELGGNLLLDSRAGLMKGGDSGPAIVPGEPERSPLIAAVRYANDSIQMPPQGRLTNGVIADLEAWVQMGAPDPRDGKLTTPKASDWEETLRERRNWWSLQPVRRCEPPSVQDSSWSNCSTDRFILAALESRQLAPAVSADPSTLIRRLSLVLTGLPPTVEQITRFTGEWDATHIQSGSINPATERLVDELLASPHFGERWARHWMDVVHFSETHGNEWNYEVHHAWRYRDYLIRAFNDDVPYDQFVREQIAGDLLSEPRWNLSERFNESVIGTAFYRFGEVNHDDCIGLPQIGFDLADNQIDTLSKAFQATTVACARCHDHKLDAVSMRDYYGLLGVLRSSRLVSHTIDAADVNAAQRHRLGELKSKIRYELADIWAREANHIASYLWAAQSKSFDPQTDGSLAELDPQRLEKWIAVLKAQKAPLEDPFEPWRMLVSGVNSNSGSVHDVWQRVAAQVASEDAARMDFNAKEFVSFGDFRHGAVESWQATGQGFREHAVGSGDFAILPEGETILKTVLPAGYFTHTLSDRLNGTLRSSVLPRGYQNISFCVLGEHSSAVRLVSNNCQLNYKNYRALTNSDLHWVTFSPPENCDALRTYAELMTMFDNPKFPDQLSALGGDKDNYKLPWEKAVGNGRSYFGITDVVLHHGSEPPRAQLSHLRALFAAEPPKTLDAVANRYAAIVQGAVTAWAEDRATDEDVRWIDACLRGGLLDDSFRQSPRLTSLVQDYRAVEAGLLSPRVIPGVADSGRGIDQPVFVRGDCTRPGEAAPRKFLEVLSRSGESFATAGSGRLELAALIARPENPLTARVMVNRIWHHLFGRGLVSTVDDFGHIGELPSHPELLDYLAADFVEHGWSIKRLIRSLVLTRTFQLASVPSVAAKDVDPQNRLLQHYPARRMEAEAIRDSILATSGRLDRTLYGMSIQPFREQENADRRLFPGPLDGYGRRSVYIKNNLMEAPQFLGVFDFPGGKVAQGRRDVTNVPAQALALLNDPFVWQEADLWAQKLAAGTEQTPGELIDVMFQTALGRRPRAAERSRLEQAAARLAELHNGPATDVLHNQSVWRDLAHAIFNLKEFIYIP